jgi:hypothetical protein
MIYSAEFSAIDDPAPVLRILSVLLILLRFQGKLIDVIASRIQFTRDLMDTLTISECVICITEMTLLQNVLPLYNPWARIPCRGYHALHVKCYAYLRQM